MEKRMMKRDQEIECFERAKDKQWESEKEDAHKHIMHQSQLGEVMRIVL